MKVTLIGLLLVVGLTVSWKALNHVAMRVQDNHIRQDGPHFMVMYGGTRGAHRAFLVLGIDPNLKDQNGETPLIAGIRSDRLDIIPILLRAGADVNAADREGNRFIDILHDYPDGIREVSDLKALVEKAAKEDWRQKRVPSRGPAEGDFWRSY